MIEEPTFIAKAPSAPNMALVLFLILSCQLLFAAGTELRRWSNDSGLVSVNNGQFQLDGR